MAIWDHQAKSDSEAQKDRHRTRYPLWTVPFSILSAYLLWAAASRWSGLPDFILPEPGEVARRLWLALQDGTLIRHTGTTLTEVLGGLSLGFVVATSLGYSLAKSKTVERVLSPYIVASQSIPVVAIAPLLVIWFGPGRISKVMICALIVFFPILINTIVGVRSVPQDLYDLMRSLRATRWQIFTKLEVPAALPVLLGGLKIGATLSVIGAVVGELVGADQGLGFLINIGRGVYDTTLVYVAVITLVVLAMTLFTSVAALEWWFLRWREPQARR
jgi:NitT/TauT family transport system permease protein